MNAHLALARPGVASLAGLGAMAGCAAASGGVGPTAVATGLSVVLAAGGALAFNQAQEVDADGLMPRTRLRPLPAGLLRPGAARIEAVLLLAAGLAGLALAGGPWPAGLAMLAAGIYNRLYTPLKRRSAFASLAGLPAGALIPAIGWAAGGGRAGAPVFALMAFFALWQVPHAWLLALSTPGEYERGGFVPPTRGLSRSQVARVLAVWGMAAVAAAALLPVFGLLRNPIPYLACLLAGGWMIASLLRAVAASSAPPAAMRRAFRAVNAFAAATVLAILVR
jgi:protoheme IX farnesyltransferase